MMDTDPVRPGRWTVVLVDDEQPTLAAYRTILSRHAPHLSVAASIDDGLAAVTTIEQLAPDVVLLDLHMPGFDGLDVLQALAQRKIPAKALVMTAFDERRLVVSALRLGAAGYLLKTSTAEQIVRAIEAVVVDDLPLSPEIARMLVGCDSGAVPCVSLTQREADVLQALAEGLSNRAIAERLFLAESTVKQYIGTLADKLGVRTRVQILVAAGRRGLIAW